MSVFGVSLVQIFMQLRWIRKDTDYLAVLIPVAENYGPQNFEYVHFSRSENFVKKTFVLTYLHML